MKYFNIMYILLQNNLDFGGNNEISLINLSITAISAVILGVLIMYGFFNGHLVPRNVKIRIFFLFSFFFLYMNLFFFNNIFVYFNFIIIICSYILFIYLLGVQQGKNDIFLVYSSMILKNKFFFLNKKNSRYTDYKDVRKMPSKSPEAHPEFAIAFTDSNNGDLIIAQGNYTHNSNIKGKMTEFINVDQRLRSVFFVFEEIRTKRITNEYEKEMYLNEIKNYKKDFDVGLFEHRDILDLKVYKILKQCGFTVNKNPLISGMVTKDEYVNAIQNYKLNDSIIDIKTNLPLD